MDTSGTTHARKMRRQVLRATIHRHPTLLWATPRASVSPPAPKCLEGFLGAVVAVSGLRTDFERVSRRARQPRISLQCSDSDTTVRRV
jgi:hypothetical protein